MSDLIKRLCRPGYDLQKEQAIQEAVIEIRELRAEVQTWKQQSESYWEKIEGVERQFPICRVKDIKRVHYMTKVVGLDPDALLYLSPGAQNVVSRQDEWKTLAKDLLREIERQTCAHEETHRGGFLWEICDSCGAKWADDEGGKPEFKWPKVVEKARAMLEATTESRP